MSRGLMLKLGALGFTVLIVSIFAISLSQMTVYASGTPEGVSTGVVGDLDGFIGTEWSRSLNKQISIRYQRTGCSCSAGYLPAELYMLHDDENLYIGLSIRTSRLRAPRQMFRAFVFLDNGDNHLWNPGDNIIIVPADEGKLLITGLDYHYPAPSRTPLDKAKLDAQQNALGIGRWNQSKGTYDFELCLPLQSGDPLDVPIEAGKSLRIIIGFDVFDRYSGSMYYGKAPSFSVFLLPKSTG